VRLQIGRRRPGVEPVGVAGHAVDAAAGGQSGERLALDRNRPVVGDPVEHLGFQDVGAGVDQVGGSVTGRGFSTKARTRPSASVETTPNRDGSSTAVRWMVATASWRR